MLIVDGRGRASKVVDLVNLHHIVSDELEPRVPKVVHDVVFPAGEEIISYKPGPTSHQDPQSLTLQTQWDR